MALHYIKYRLGSFSGSLTDGSHPIFSFQSDLPWCFYGSYSIITVCNSRKLGPMNLTYANTHTSDILHDTHHLIYNSFPNAPNRQAWLSPLHSYLNVHCFRVKNTVSIVDLCESVFWPQHSLAVWPSEGFASVSLCLYKMGLISVPTWHLVRITHMRSDM